MNDFAKDYWDKQTSSLHRAADAQFYRRKAEEHAFLMLQHERATGCLDLGCGAGELLLHLVDFVSVSAGLDYSQSMLDEATNRLDGKGVQLINADLFQYLPNSEWPVWTTTGAINQYLDAVRMGAFLDLFAKNECAQSLFLYDCVDPVRYALMPFGISYLRRSESHRGWRAVAMPTYRIASRVILGAKLAAGLLGRSPKRLGGVSMGFGYLPRFWIEAAAARNLQIEIVSSRYYEYRYHVIMRKLSA